MTTTCTDYLPVPSSRERFDYVECSHCSMVYMTPVIDQDRLTESYGSDGAQEAWVDKIATDAEPAAQHPVKRLFVKRTNLIGSINKLRPTGRILDVGCGDGEMLALAKDLYGYEVEGAELNDVSRAEAERRLGIAIHDAPAEQLELPRSRYDVIMLNQVVEHLADPVRCLEPLIPALRPDGILVLGCPNMESLSMKLFRDRHTHVGLGHVNFFTRATLTRFEKTLA